jgi:hypothetical protein
VRAVAGHRLDATAGKMRAGQEPAAQGMPDMLATPVLENCSGGRYPKCGICQRYIKSGESYWGIQHGVVWKYAEHEDCP